MFTLPVRVGGCVEASEGLRGGGAEGLHSAPPVLRRRDTEGARRARDELERTSTRHQVVAAIAGAHR